MMRSRKGSKSVNTRAADGTIARRDPELAKALEEVAQWLPKKFAVDDWAIKRQVEAYTKARTDKSPERYEILNAIFDQLYGAYMDFYTNPLALKFFLH